MRRIPTRAENGGFASGLERRNYERLTQCKADFEYESDNCKIPYELPIRDGLCLSCGADHVVSNHLYTCDFLVRTESGKEIFVETKGAPLAWDGKARTKHIQIKKQYPEMDLRFVFTNANNKISKRSKTTNAQWCEKYGFGYATALIPKSWLKE